MTAFSRTRSGLLELDFEQRGSRTVLLRDVQKAPLMIVRPFELPCGTLSVFIVNPTGGFLGGDLAEIRVQVGPGARALLLTQSATRVQPSPSGLDAVQNIEFSVAAGGRLEYYPERTIPFAGSHFRQTLRADLEAGAEFGLTETLTTGRVAMGERLQFGRYRSSTALWRAGQRVFLDRVDVQPAAGDLTAPGVLGGQDYSASGVWIGGTEASEVTQFPAVPGRLASGRTARGAVWLRSLAGSGPELDAALTEARERLRRELFGAPKLEIRR
ncbi:urease accessory protein UreD [Deinococcus sp. KNUC1210]|uniref:urease accessory protein UreD n=1 Tax=Deinococcus sp. KNUC1210 TaxID=2917691 RepID=UPI001EEF8C75|nr:urease accessory protein UreD [Deinococcus sp. KNUC1210]ULH14381.1 urease accessory protein UreD [Deinococcus sp. KNUC1210]